jgi:molybdopterin adenylyltransferase
MAPSVAVAGPCRLGALEDGGGHRPHRAGVDARLVGEQHHGDLHVGVVGESTDAHPERGGLARRVFRVVDDPDVPAPRRGTGDVLAVVADHHQDGLDTGRMGRDDGMGDEREAVHLDELLGGAEPLRSTRGEHEHADTGHRLRIPAREPIVSEHRHPSDDRPSAGAVGPSQAIGGDRRTAVVVTASDGVASGHRTDDSGRAVADLLVDAGFTVTSREVVADERDAIATLLRRLADGGGVALVAITGGTGFGPRDVTPEATEDVIERGAPGLAEAMRASGRASTPMADLSRGVCGIRGSTLLVDLPGSPRGAVESLTAVLGLLPHALDLLAGDTQRHPAGHGDTGAS